MITHFPKTIAIKADSFQLLFPIWKKPIVFKDIARDTSDIVSDAIKNAYYPLIFDKDILRFNYENFPFVQKNMYPNRKGRQKIYSKKVTVHTLRHSFGTRSDVSASFRKWHRSQVHTGTPGLQQLKNY